MLNVVNHQNTLFNHFLAQMRNIEVQQDSMRFRRNLERTGELFAYEISKKLNYAPADVTTPLGMATTNLITDKIVVATILRAGLPLHQGILNYFDWAENAFVSAYRKHHKDNTFEIKVEYMSCPPLDGKILILCDPMLATGRSMELAYNALMQRGTPAHTHFVALIASEQGIHHLQSNTPSNCDIWVGCVDDELTAQAYIVPGLGDAGDLAFGIKTEQ